MRIGTFHLVGAPNMDPAERRINDTIEQMVLADELGLDYVWVAEHHFSNYGYSTNPLLLIAKASALAKRIRFGQAIIVTPLWQPLRLAEDIAVTDILTGGRLDLGVGRGYQPMEFAGFDLNIDESRDVFNEQMELMTLAWSRDDFTFEGQHFRVPHPITVLPRPVQTPHPPIWMAAQSATSVDWAARQGYSLLLSGSTTSQDQIAEWVDRYRGAWQAAGHADREPRISIQRFVHVTETEAEAREAVWQTRWQRRTADSLRQGISQIVAGQNHTVPPAEEPTEEAWWDRLVYGTPDRCIAEMHRTAAMGATDFIGWFDVGGLPIDDVRRSMRMFAREVMPAVAGVTSSRMPAHR